MGEEQAASAAVVGGAAGSNDRGRRTVDGGGFVGHWSIVLGRFWEIKRLISFSVEDLSQEG